MATSSNAKQAPILIVAALSRELAVLAGESHTGLTLLETGEGVANAQRHLETWLDRGTARAVLSIGFAGALSPLLRAGDIVIAEKVRDCSATPDAKLLDAARLIKTDDPTIHFGVAVTTHEILWQAQSKRALAASLAWGETAAVDMESEAIANVCGRRGVPFLIARSITDLLDEDLPLDFNQFRTGDGRVDQMRVVRAAMLRPSTFPELIGLRKRSKLCAERMAALVRRLVPLIS